MSDVCVRLAWLVALVPGTCGVFMLAFCDPISSLHPLARLQFAAGAATSLVLGATVAIWRRYVRRSKSRVAVPLVGAVLLLAHVAWWQPVMDIDSCVENDFLRLGQSGSLLGLWSIMCAFCWWGALHTVAPRVESLARVQGRRFEMTPNAFRIVIGMALFPLTLGLIWLLFPIFSTFVGDDPAAMLVIALCNVLVVVAWWLLWRSALTWTPVRRRRTRVLMAIVTLVPLAAVVPDGAWNRIGLSPPSWEHRWSIITLCWALWIAVSAWLWREDRLPGFEAARSAGRLTRPAVDGALQREASPRAVARATPESEFRLAAVEPDLLAAELARCPRCAYSLAGLPEVRCPECGWASTVDDIVGRSLMRVMEAE